jgi:hypothetical protein
VGSPELKVGSIAAAVTGYVSIVFKVPVNSLILIGFDRDLMNVRDS